MATITVEGPDPTNLPDGRATMQIDILDQGLLLVVQAMCTAYNYQTTVANPDFNPEKEESEDNLRNVVNPVGPGTFALQKTVDFWMDHGRAYAKKQGEVQGGQAALEQVAPLAQVTIKEVK